MVIKWAGGPMSPSKCGRHPAHSRCFTMVRLRGRAIKLGLLGCGGDLGPITVPTQLWLSQAPGAGCSQGKRYRMQSRGAGFPDPAKGHAVPFLHAPRGYGVNQTIWRVVNGFPKGTWAGKECRSFLSHPSPSQPRSGLPLFLAQSIPHS